jgi:hypothetical protein
VQVDDDDDDDDDSSGAHLHLLGLTFPGLRDLNLGDAHLGSGSLFAGLLGCQHLTELTLSYCECGDEEETVTAAALLGRLTGLCSLVLEGSTPRALASEVSTLTSLSLGNTVVYDTEDVDDALTVEQLVSIAARNPQLQSLHCSPVVPSPTAQDLQLLLTSLTSLTSLSLGTRLQAAEVLTLLRYGTHITSLSIHSMELDYCLPEQQCSWRELRLGDYFPNVLTLANLVNILKDSVEVSFTGYSRAAARLELPLTTVPTPQVPALLHKAAAVIACNQSWKQEPEPLLSLDGTEYDGSVQPHFTAATRLQLLQALAPLRHAGIRMLHLHGFSCEFEMGAPEVEALSTSIGSDIKSMLLGSGGKVTLSPTFWPALRSHFPALRDVWLGKHSDGAVHTSDLVSFCKDAPHPFTLGLHNNICDAAGRQELQTLVTASAGANAPVIKESPR